jgi:hypothetical protein
MRQYISWAGAGDRIMNALRNARVNVPIAGQQLPVGVLPTANQLLMQRNPQQERK